LEEVRRPTFRPGSDTLETLLFTRSTLSGARSHVQLFDEAQRTITQLEFQFNGIHVTKTLPNGDLLAGDVNASAIGELEHYRRATNTWTSINQSAGDGQVLIAYTPFELDDGVDLAFRLYAKDAKAFLSIADFAPAAQFPAAPYTARFTEEHAEYARTGVGANGVAPVFAAATSVATYLTTGRGLTAVLVSKDNASSAYTLSAYAWPAGATVFTTLYSGVSISKGLGDLMTGGREKVQCHADGTVYAIVSESGGSRLALAGAAGERSLGVVAPSTDHTAVLGQLRFVDGAYYAAVGLLLVNATYQGPELEIVKLVP
jgi:hypothetical protein